MYSKRVGRMSSVSTAYGKGYYRTDRPIRMVKQSLATSLAIYIACVNHLLCTQNSPNTPISPYLFKYLRHSKYGHESFLVFHHLRLNISMTLAIVLQ